MHLHIDQHVDSSNRRGGFSLIELLVVVTIIALLIAMLQPSIQLAMEASRRAICAANLHQIHVGAFNYAAMNKRVLFICRGRDVQKAFSQITGGHQWRSTDSQVDWIGALASVQLVAREKTDVGGGVMRREPSNVWNCPSRRYRAQWESGSGGIDQLVVGYQYFGGIENWRHPLGGTVKSRSPVKLSSSKGGWMLASDTTMRIDYAWGGGRGTAYQDIPSHVGNPGVIEQYRDGAPAGGNQAYVDGSVEWVEFADMVQIHSWNQGGTRKAYGWQNDWGDYELQANPFFE